MSTRNLARAIGLLCLTLSLAPAAAAGRAHADIDLRVDDLDVRAEAPSVSGRATYRWDWGDGSVSTGASVRHAYARAGVYHVVLIVTDEDGHRTRHERDVTVRATAPARADVQARVDGARVVVDLPGAWSRVRWDWGDGGTSAGAHAEHRYARGGDYLVRVEAWDHHGRRVQQSRWVHVEVERERGHERAEQEDDDHRHGLSVSVDAPGLDVSAGLGHEHRAARRQATWESEGDVSISSQRSNRNVPGAGPALVLAGVAGAALLVGFVRRRTL